MSDAPPAPPTAAELEDVPEASQEEAAPAEPPTIVSGARRRGKRQVMKKKTLKDEEGYLGTASSSPLSLPLSPPCPPTSPETPLTPSSPPSNQRRTHLGILLRRRRPPRIHIVKDKILPPSLHSVVGEGEEESDGEGGPGEYHEFFREEVADPPGVGRGRGRRAVFGGWMNVERGRKGMEAVGRGVIGGGRT